MGKKWFTYYFYKFYKLIAVVLIVVMLNFPSGALIDLFIKVFSGIPELQCLIATLVLTLIVSIVLFVGLFFGALKLRAKLFTTIPEKPRAKSILKKAEYVTSSLGTRTISSVICSCSAGMPRDLMGSARFQLADGTDALLSVNVVKRDDGSGLLRMDCKTGGKVQTCAFRINFCPNCGGRYVVKDNHMKATDHIA